MVNLLFFKMLLEWDQLSFDNVILVNITWLWLRGVMITWIGGTKRLWRDQTVQSESIFEFELQNEGWCKETSF